MEAASNPPPASAPPATPATPCTQSSPTARPLRRWQSEELLGQAGEAVITHGNQTYRLRCTTTGKLILTK